MYRRDRQQMPQMEEGSVFFRPVTPETELGVVPPRSMGLQRGMLTGGFVEAQARSNAPRVMGLNPDLLTHGFSGARGMGADEAAPSAEPSYMDKIAAMNPWVIGGVAAALGFGGMYLWRKR
jgi:hypothetical protein